LKNYSFDRLFSAIDDGFSAKAFHSKCDNNEYHPIFVIIETEFDHVFGGYTTIAWGSDGIAHTDNDAYIFSIRQKRKSETKNTND
jgi:hypothetical protein